MCDLEKAITDIFNDSNFKVWVLYPTDTLDQYWNEVMRRNPQKKEAVNKARSIFLGLDEEIKIDYPKPEIVNKMLKIILSSK